MQGQIQQAEFKENGKLRLQINGQWFSAKPPELANMVGQTITFEPAPWTIPNTNKVINFINDYTVSGAYPTPADQAMNQAMGNQPPPMGSPTPPPVSTNVGNPGTSPTYIGPNSTGTSPQKPSVDRDASIVAQALTKVITKPGDSVDTVFMQYTALYRLYTTWTPGTVHVPVQPQKPQTPPVDFSDDIPFN